MIPEPGYVRYVGHLGDDLSVVNAARASFDKQSVTFEDRDRRLLRYLMREEHSSVLRHQVITFEIYAPMLVKNQWWKYVVASAHTADQLGWNETSRRYVTEEPEFYIPARDAWRAAPESRKQGSGGPLSEFEAGAWTLALESHARISYDLYEAAMDAGIAPEQARLFLPAYALFIRWRWTASLGAVLHFLEQRLATGAQHEIQVYAEKVREIVQNLFPATSAAYLDKERNAG